MESSALAGLSLLLGHKALTCCYLAFIPAEISIEEDAEVVIMQIVEENGEELLEAVEDDEIADAVFNIVMERAEAEEE